MKYFKHKGAHSEPVACTWLLRQGYDVFRNVSDRGSVDVVAIKDGEISLFDVKSSYGGVTHNRDIAGRHLGLKYIVVDPFGDCDICDYSTAVRMRRQIARGTSTAPLSTATSTLQ
jgi:hypothetical protein